MYITCATNCLWYAISLFLFGHIGLFAGVYIGYKMKINTSKTKTMKGKKNE